MKRFNKEWFELIEKAKSEGLSCYMLGKAVFPNNYRRIYRTDLLVTQAMYESLLKAYEEQSENSLLKSLQEDIDVVLFNTPDEVRNQQIDGEIGLEFKPFVDDESEYDMKILPQRKKPYSELQLKILEMFNEGKTDKEIHNILKAPGASVAFVKKNMYDEGGQPQPKHPRKRDKVKVSVRGAYLKKGTVLKIKRSFTAKNIKLLEDVNELTKKSDVYIDDLTEKYGTSVGLLVRAFSEHLYLKDGSRYIDEINKKKIQEKPTAENEAAKELIEETKESFVKAKGQIISQEEAPVVVENLKNIDKTVMLDMDETMSEEPYTEADKDKVLNKEEQNTPQTVEEVVESLKTPTIVPIVEKETEHELSATLPVHDHEITDFEQIEGITNYELLQEIKKLKNEIELLKVSSTTNVSQTINYNFAELFAPICYEPSTDKPFPAPVKQSTVMFERLGDMFVAVGDICYQMNVKFDVMDGPKSVNVGSSLMIIDVRNGTPFKYVLTVSQFNRFKDTDTAKHWFANRYPREMFHR